MHVENVNGVAYHVADIKQSILFPEHSGDLTIDPLGMTFVARIKCLQMTRWNNFLRVIQRCEGRG